MTYALWDMRSNNLVASFESRRDALAMVLSGIERNGLQDTDTLCLDVEDDQGEITNIAHGAGLAEMARREHAAGTLVG